ncbi:beta-ketoacyl-[acyl-carrier-protein] synthase family protein [Streptosporangium sp. NPDC051023]|uniref:beta-ketoacyl-[acyl-carrier-protein] synthase family protein n=1 Tax=Streptosporangium sp. NPDC051023 TaxID=3155410 RepID=UPI0034508A91
MVTGLGATTPVGGDVATTWSALLEGRSGVSGLGGGWVTDSPVTIAAKAAVDPAETLSRIEVRRLDRCEQFGLVAAREAWADAGLGEGGVDPERLGVVVASGIGGVMTTISAYDSYRENGWQSVSPLTVPKLMPNGPAGWIGLEFRAMAGVHGMVSACASGADAVAYGIDMIRLGRADVILAGGTEAVIHPLTLVAFAAMHALSTRNDDPARASRPFDKERDGFVLGEGAGIVVLEAEEHARARGIRVYAEAAGAGCSGDAYHIAKPNPSGEGAVLSMRRAIADADLSPSDVVHVNAHATSTPAGDVMEVTAIRKVLGDHPVLTATKSMTGHLLGGAGGVASVVAVRTLYDRMIHPTANLDELDSAIVADVARGEPRPLPGAGPVGVLSNSFGFGGHNASLIFTGV